ncbi:MAG TPA: Hpt domain-containing protein [Candidatus Limnocylindrales bacterium]|jgi:HPt (histidine-containing phosphotransfer) domain-containing protein
MNIEDAPILDDAVLDELRESTGGDEDFVRELVEAYVAEATGYLDAMTHAIAGGDTAAIVRPAHTLKSSSATLGAMRLAGISRGIEEAGRAGHAEGMAAAVERAHSTWTETIDALRAAGLAT